MDLKDISSARDKSSLKNTVYTLRAGSIKERPRLSNEIAENKNNEMEDKHNRMAANESKMADDRLLPEMRVAREQQEAEVNEVYNPDPVYQTGPFKRRKKRITTRESRVPSWATNALTNLTILAKPATKNETQTEKRNRRCAWAVAIVCALVAMVILVTLLCVYLLEEENKSTEDQAASASRQNASAHQPNAIVTSQSNNIETITTPQSSNIGETTSEPNIDAITNTPPLYSEISGNDIVVEYENRENYSIEYAGEWASWSSFSACSVSCGGGIRWRMRECISEETPCIGVGTQQMMCNVAPCININGPRNEWSDWSDCSVTCGRGQRIRTRHCPNGESGVACAANMQQRRICNDFECPDCNATCPDNQTRHASCYHCSCTDFTGILGVVIDTNNEYGLSGIVISSSRAPRLLIYNITENNGRFYISTDFWLCEDEILVFDDKAGAYESQEVAVTDIGNIVRLNRKEHLRITVQPEDQVLAAGSSLRLCCEATGVPGPLYYEWFYNDVTLILTTVGGGESTFEDSSITVDRSGYYSCRASNDHSAVVSEPALVIVKDTTKEFCPSQPSSYFIDLPFGCEHQNRSIFDVGQCPETPCPDQDGPDSQCPSLSTYCCGAVGFTRVDLECTDVQGTFNHSVYMATKCGCVPCAQKKHFVSVRFLTESGSPWNGGIHVAINGDTTFVWNGFHGFHIDSQTTRIPMTVTRNTIFGPTYILNVPKPTPDIIKWDIVLYKLDEQSSDILHASQAYTLEMAEDDIVLNVTFPENSCFDELVEDGHQLYTGNATVYSTLVTSLSEGNAVRHPGDFTTIDRHGDQSHLFSLGIFSWLLNDLNGNPLRINSDISIDLVLQASQFDAFDGSRIKLWRLNPSDGYWEQEANVTSMDHDQNASQITMRSIIQGYGVSNEWFMFGYQSEKTCLSKLHHVARTSDYETLQQEGVRSHIVVTDTRGAFVSVSKQPKAELVFGNSKMATSCFAHPCHNDMGEGPTYNYQSYLIDNALTPIGRIMGDHHSDGMETGLVFTDYSTLVVHQNSSLITTNGPIYDTSPVKWSLYGICSNDGNSGNYFQFERPVCSMQNNEIGSDTDIQLGIYNPELCLNPMYYALWFGYQNYIDNANFKTCYIKVSLVNLTDARVRAKSFVYTEGYDYINEGSLYGWREICPTSQIGSTPQAVCLEVKRPDTIGCSMNDTESNDQALTRLEISIPNIPAYISNINVAYDRLDVQRVFSSINDSVFHMHLMTSQNNYGRDQGIYCHSGGSAGESREGARVKCMASFHDVTFPPYETDQDAGTAAVQFTRVEP